MNTETERVIREYRFTVIIMGTIIVCTFAVFAFVLYKYIPDTVYKVTKQALNEVWDERLVPDK